MAARHSKKTVNKAPRLHLLPQLAAPVARGVSSDPFRPWLMPAGDKDKCKAACRNVPIAFRAMCESMCDATYGPG